MNTWKYVSVVLSVAGFFVGFYSAWCWIKASKVNIYPAWELVISDDCLTIQKNIMGWVTGNQIAFKKSGDLNSSAAKWTAVTILVTTIASVISTVA